MKILATYNIKGGVGKTATAVNLSYLAARDGMRVLLWDLDPQAAATYTLRIRPKVKGGGKGLIRGSREIDDAIKGTDFESLDLLPADFTYRNLDLLLGATKKPTRRLARVLSPLAAEYDLIFLDCPPGISLLSESVLQAADSVLIPLIPTTLSLRTFDQLTEFIAEFDGHRPSVLAFFSMIDRRKRLHLEIAERLPAERKDVAGTSIPALSLIERMSVERAPVPAFAPRSKATQVYEQLWAEVRDRML
ncbi:MAG TPA: AAA family ATPase [Streptosporangiaceae bacterium]|nr:AAA family ATPase [Streptosporangiaceae bacterium]